MGTARAEWSDQFYMPGPIGSVSAIAIAEDGSGDIYIGGQLAAAGNVAVNSIAKWDGTTSSWSALGTGMEGTSGYVAVKALAFDSAGNLYAGGSFNKAGGIPASNIAKWDGTSWSPLGSGVNGVVHALAFDSAGNLYAGGEFTTAGGVSASNIAQWDTTTSSWSPLGDGVAGTSDIAIRGVSALAFDSKGNLYAGGGFTTAGGVSASNIAKWDSTTSSWSALGTGMDGPVNALAFDSAGNLYAGGRFAKAGGVSASNIAKWDGTSWSALGLGISHTGVWPLHVTA